MSLRYVDPHRRRGHGCRVAERFGRSPAGHWFARQVSTRLDPMLYRATGGRFTTSMGVVVNAPLVTIGAKSGQPREVQLTYFHDGPGGHRVGSRDLRSSGTDGRDRVAVVVDGAEPVADGRRAGVPGYLPKIRLMTPQKPPPPEPCGSGASPSVPGGCGPAALVVGLSRRGGAYTRS